MSLAPEPRKPPLPRHLAGLALAVATGAALLAVWQWVPGLLARIGLADLWSLAFAVSAAAVLAAATRLERHLH